MLTKFLIELHGATLPSKQRTDPKEQKLRFYKENHCLSEVNLFELLENDKPAEGIFTRDDEFIGYVVCPQKEIKRKGQESEFPLLCLFFADKSLPNEGSATVFVGCFLIEKEAKRGSARGDLHSPVVVSSFLHGSSEKATHFHSSSRPCAILNSNVHKFGGGEEEASEFSWRHLQSRNTRPAIFKYGEELQLTLSVLKISSRFEQLPEGGNRDFLRMQFEMLKRKAQSLIQQKRQREPIPAIPLPSPFALPSFSSSSSILWDQLETINNEQLLFSEYPDFTAPSSLTGIFSSSSSISSFLSCPLLELERLKIQDFKEKFKYSWQTVFPLLREYSPQEWFDNIVGFMEGEGLNVKETTDLFFAVIELLEQDGGVGAKEAEAMRHCLMTFPQDYERHQHLLFDDY